MPDSKKCTFAGIVFSTMAASIFIPGNLITKKDKYAALLPQLKALVTGEPDFIANVANIIAALKETFGFLWIGVYRVSGTELLLGPFQGPVACTRIGYGKGVCGKAWKDGKTIRVDDVNEFPGHIACSAMSKSEIVLPAFKNNEVFLVLDIDSDCIAAFDDDDERYLGAVVKIIENL
jgi:L-methionine (R)-S-oxide reductase